MRFIFNFSKFESESYLDKLGTGDQLKDDTRSDYEDIIKEYNQKKGTLESIFKGKLDDERIKSDIAQKIYSGDSKSPNKLLKKLENILWIERSISKISDKDKNNSKIKSEIEKKLRDLEKVSLVVDNKLKEETGKSMMDLQSKIKNIEDLTKSNDKRLKEVQDKLKKEKDEFSRFEKEIYTKIRSQE